VLKSRLLTPIPPRLRASGRAFIAVAHNRNLLRLQLSFGAAWTAEWTFTVALGVVAFRQGGASAVGLVTFLRLAPPALIAPFTSTLADRFLPRTRVDLVGLRPCSSDRRGGRRARRPWPNRCYAVRARTPLQLYMLSRADFLHAVGGYSASRRGAESLLDERLTTFTPNRRPPGSSAMAGPSPGT